MSRITEMNIPTAKESQQSVTQHDFGNNMGELFKKSTLETKQGKKIKEQKEAIETAKLLLKELHLTDSFDVSKIKTLNIINILYTGKPLENQIRYINDKKTTEELVSQAFYAVVNKQEWYQQSKSMLDAEYE